MSRLEIIMLACIIYLLAGCSSRSHSTMIGGEIVLDPSPVMEVQINPLMSSPKPTIRMVMGYEQYGLFPRRIKILLPPMFYEEATGYIQIGMGDVTIRSRRIVIEDKKWKAVIESKELK